MPLPALSVLPANSRPGVGIGTGIDRTPMMMMRAARDGVRNLGRYGAPAAADGTPDMMDPNSIAGQNYLANSGQYGRLFAPGSIGDQNARANAPAPAPAQMMQRGGYGATTQTFTGSPADNAALSMLAPAGPGGARMGHNGAYGAPSMMGRMTPAEAAATNVSDTRFGYDMMQSYKTNVAPFLVTPGMAPEHAASNIGAQEMMARRAAGLPDAVNSRQVFQGKDAMGNPTLSTTQGSMDASVPALARDQTSNLSPVMAMAGDVNPGIGPNANPAGPLAPTAYDQNRSAVEMMAQGARDRVAQATAPGLVTLGMGPRGPVQAIRQANGQLTLVPGGDSYPREVNIGDRNLTEVSKGKFVDTTSGQPFDWGNIEKHLSLREFRDARETYAQFNGDFGKYVADFTQKKKDAIKAAATELEAHKTAALAATAPAAGTPAPGAAAAAPAPAAVPAYESREAVRDAYRAKKLSFEDAQKIIDTQFAKPKK